MINVTIWNEFVHEVTNEAVKEMYPKGIHGAIADFLGTNEDMNIRTATLKEPEHGLTDEVLENTDVLLWWGHCAHAEVDDTIVTKVQDRILEGMGLIVLHSGHFSKIFKRMMGTHCSLKWREVAEKERIWNIAPAHPITQGIDEYFELPNTEMYGERFDVPEPLETIFISWFEGGEVFRSGLTYKRGNGKIFYFKPGHETYPIYYDKNIQKVITNAVRWAEPTVRIPFSCPSAQPLEKIEPKDVNFASAGISQNQKGEEV